MLSEITDKQRVFRRLGRVSTATLTTQLFKRGLRNVFLTGLRPVNPAAARLVGEASTLRYIPAREDIDLLSVFDDYNHPQRRAVETVPPGNVLVMDCRGEVGAASIGSILLTRLRMRGVAGFVADGGVRDWPTVAGLDLPVYALAPSAPTNLVLHHAVDLDVPIACAGVAVYPGDVLVGDGEGVVVIPRHLAREIAEAAVEQETLEGFIARKVEEGRPLRGLYPPDDETLTEYDTWRRQNKESSTSRNWAD